MRATGMTVLIDCLVQLSPRCSPTRRMMFASGSVRHRLASRGSASRSFLRSCRALLVITVACIGVVWLRRSPPASPLMAGGTRHSSGRPGQGARPQTIEVTLLSSSSSSSSLSPPPLIAHASAIDTVAAAEAETDAEADAVTATAVAVELECSTYAGPMRWRWNPGGRGAKTQTLRALPLADAPALRPRAPPLRSFPARELRLLPGTRFASAAATNVAFLKALEPARLFWTLRATAGLPQPPGARPYGGWEAPGAGIRGHFVGHYLGALGTASAAAPDDAALRGRVDDALVLLEACQRAHTARGAATAGYLSAFPPREFEEVEKLCDPPPPGGCRAWVPHYAVHKLLAGLLAMHEALGRAAAGAPRARYGRLPLAPRSCRTPGVRHGRVARGPQLRSGCALRDVRAARRAHVQRELVARRGALRSRVLHGATRPRWGAPPARASCRRRRRRRWRQRLWRHREKGAAGPDGARPARGARAGVVAVRGGAGGGGGRDARHARQCQPCLYPRRRRAVRADRRVARARCGPRLLAAATGGLLLCDGRLVVPGGVAPAVGTAEGPGGAWRFDLACARPPGVVCHAQHHAAQPEARGVEWRAAPAGGGRGAPGEGQRGRRGRREQRTAATARRRRVGPAGARGVV